MINIVLFFQKYMFIKKYLIEAGLQINLEVCITFHFLYMSMRNMERLGNDLIYIYKLETFQDIRSSFLVNISNLHRNGR